MISESECVHFYLSGRIDGCNENFNDIFYKSHVERIASILWILLEAPKRRIYCRENIFAINFLLMIIIYADINTYIVTRTLPSKLTTLPIYYKNIKYLDSYYKNNTSGYHILVVEFFIISMRRTSICIEKI